MTTEQERQSALVEILNLPDDPEMEPRTHVVTVEGKPSRFHRWRDLAKRYEVSQQMKRLNDRLQ